MAICSILKLEATTDEFIMKIEKEINKKLLVMNKRDEIIDQIDSKMRSTRGKLPLVHIYGANIETNTKDARETIENLALDQNETIISLHVESFYPNVPLKEAIAVVLQKLYSQESPEIQRATMKMLLNTVVSKFCFECNDSCYVQVMI